MHSSCHFQRTQQLWRRLWAAVNLTSVMLIKEICWLKSCDFCKSTYNSVWGGRRLTHTGRKSSVVFFVSHHVPPSKVGGRSPQTSHLQISDLIVWSSWEKSEWAAVLFESLDKSQTWVAIQVTVSSSPLSLITCVSVHLIFTIYSVFVTYCIYPF